MRKWINLIREFQMFDPEKGVTVDGGGLPPIDPPDDGDPWRDEPDDGNQEPVDPDYHNGVDYSQFDDFTRAYFEALIFTTEDMAQEEGWNCYMDSIYRDSVGTGYRQCMSFQEEFANLLSKSYEKGSTESQAGHDFWLTRNRHGAGFWDRGLGTIGDELTNAAQQYGEAYVEIDGGSGAVMVRS